MIGGGIRINKAARSGEVTFMLGVVIMNCRGLVDPQNKPFGNVLPLELQVKIMFWVECFVIMDKRKKVLQEFKGLRKCDVTGFPQHLGEDRWWNQVVVRLHAPRKNGCHHCHRLFDHRLSVGRRPVMIGRRKCTYNTIDKVMGRLDRVLKVLETMRHMAIVNVH